MATVNLLGEIALEETQQAVLEGVLDVSSTEETVMLLHQILSRLGFPDQVNASLRVSIVGSAATVNVGGNITTVTTVSTVTNQAQMGGLSAIYDQHNGMMGSAGIIRSHIAVT